jgi:Na+/H+-dicarboxylate symporter
LFCFVLFCFVLFCFHAHDILTIFSRYSHDILTIFSRYSHGTRFPNCRCCLRMLLRSAVWIFCLDILFGYSVRICCVFGYAVAMMLLRYVAIMLLQYAVAICCCDVLWEILLSGIIRRDYQRRLRSSMPNSAEYPSCVRKYNNLCLNLCLIVYVP